jgi:hypothetical protein
MAYKDRVFKMDGGWYAEWLTPLGWRRLRCQSFSAACRAIEYLYNPYGV